MPQEIIQIGRLVLPTALPLFKDLTWAKVKYIYIYVYNCLQFQIVQNLMRHVKFIIIITFSQITGKPMNDEETIVENGPMKDKKSNEDN